MKYILTLRYIKLLSYLSARYLQEVRKESHKHRYTYYYGFQIIYGSINKLLLLILTGLLLGILPELLIVTLSFVLLRIWTGGLHFDNYTKCAWASLLSLTVMGLFSKCLPISNITALIISLTVSILFLIYAPVEHKNRPIKKEERNKYKIISLVILCLLFLNYLYFSINSIIYGILLSGIIVLPIINKLK
jgi:accessory gene regulator B